MKIQKEDINLFISTFEEDINNFIDDGCSNLSDTIYDLYREEGNYNNADPTSRQKIWDGAEIEKLISLSISKLKQNSDRCSYCGRLIEDRDWLYHKSRGLTVVEVHHCIGYKCNKCKDEYRAYYVEFFEE